MDIKLKNKYVHIVLLVIALYSLGGSLYLLKNISTHVEFLNKNPYFYSNSFKNDLNNYGLNVIYMHEKFNNYEDKTIEQKVDNKDIDKLRKSYENKFAGEQSKIESDYADKINNSVGNTAETNRLTIGRDKEIEEAKKNNTRSIEELKNEVIVTKDKSYWIVKNYVKARGDIKYYIKNNGNNEIYTNLGNVQNIRSYIKDKALFYIKLPNNEFDWNANLNSRFNIYEKFMSDSLQGYFIIPKDMSKTSQLYKNYEYYNLIRRAIIKECLVVGGLLLISIIILLILRRSRDIKIINFEKLKSSYNKISLDLRGLIFLLASLLIIHNTYVVPIPFKLSNFVALSITTAYILYFIVNLTGAIELYKNKEKLKIERNKCITNRFLSPLKEGFIKKSILFKIFCFGFFTILIFPVMRIYNNSESFPLLEVCYIIFYVFVVLSYALRKTKHFGKIMNGTENIVAGNLDFTIDEKGSGDLKKLANNINNIKEGYKKSLDNQIKSERLKTELITNVSHDLKTPLTSIINYVDLLKKENLTKEERDSYIEILDKKSQRLRLLIEDLFEASKVTSGAVELNYEKIDILSLLRQIIGEYDEKIEASTLTFKINTQSQKVFAKLDGKKTWRVFENLISNALKYSHASTRVYIDIIEEDDKVKVSIKNISAYEMNFNGDEIAERFKRGDASRSTEGSGLGLAIAQSIVELQGGRFKIEIDGDLFKVNVIFNKYIENE